MAPVHNVTSYSVASTSSATSSSSSKVMKSSDFRREPSESEDRFHSVTSKGFSFSDSLFENARERFHHRVRRILDDWDMTEGVDDSWFGKGAISRTEFEHERVSAHSGESKEKNIYAAVSENGDYEIRMDIVGMRLKDVRVRVAGQRRLVVEGSKVEEGEMNVCRHCQRKTLYQFSLPDDAKMDAISATFSCDGILIITVPTKIITCERSGRYLQENILPETRNSRHCTTVAQPSFTEPSQGSTTLVKEKEKESQQLCMNKNYTSEMKRSNSIFKTRAFDVNCASDSVPEALTSNVHLEKGRKAKEVIIPIIMMESDDIAERKQERACSREPGECSSSSEQLSSVQRQSNHHTSASSEATLSTEAEGSIVQRRQTQKQGLAATESLSVTSNEELLLENGITVNDHKKDVDQTVMVAGADTETSDRPTYDHRRTLQHKISEGLLSPSQEVCCEKIQRVGEMKTAWDVHHSEDDSPNSVMEGKQSLDFDEMHTKSPASESSILLEVREKGSFLEDLHFISMREAMTSALRETLSEYNAVPSDGDLLSFYRQLQEQNAIQHSEPLSVTQEDDTHYKIVVDVSTLRRTRIDVFLRNRNEIQVVGEPLQHESDYQVSEIFKRFALPEETSNVATSASLSSDGFLMITVVKKGNLNELTTEEDNGKAGFLTSARDDSFEIRKQNLTTKSSASSLATVDHAEHLTEPDSSSHSKEEDTLIEESFSSTSDQVSTNLLDSCTSMSSVEFDKEQPCSIEEHESEALKSPSELRKSISSDRTAYDHRRTLRHKTSDGLLNPFKEVCCEKIQLVVEKKTAWDVHHSEDDSENFVMEGKQSLDSDEMHTKSSASESSVLLEVSEKGSFLEDLHFVSMREAMTSTLRETLSEYNAVPSDEDLLSFYRQLHEQNAINHNELLSATQDDDTHYKIVIDVSTLRRTGIAVFLQNRNEIQVVREPLQHESDHQVSEIFKRFALPEETSNVATSALLSSDGFLMITVVKKGNLNELTTEEDNGMAGFLTSANDDSFEIRKRNLTESSASSLATVVSAEHLNEPDSSSHSKEEDTFIEESFSSTSDQVSTNLLDSCTSMSSVESNKEQPCSVEEQLSKTPKSPSELRKSISSEYNETDALVSVTVAPSVEIQGENKANDISLYKETFIGKENSSECHESSTHTEQSEDSSFLEYQQHKAGSSEALESEKDADTSVNSSSFSDQNLDANNLVSASPVIEETNEETSSTGSCILLNVQEKGLFDEDIFFQNIRHKLQAKERKLLSRERDVSSIAEDFSDEENLSFLDCRDNNQTVTSIDDGDQFMIIIDVSESANVKELQLEVVGNNAVLIKGSAVTNGAEQDDVKTFSERLDLPPGTDVESGHCATSEDGVLVIAFSKVTSAAERISTDDTLHICISGDDCPDYGEMMLSTTVENINTSDTDSKDFMKSVTGGHRASCGVDTSSQTKRSAERNLSAEVTGLSGDIHDSLSTGHSTNNNTKPETIKDTSDALDVGLKFDERCHGIFSVQGSSEKEKGHILKTSCELNQTLQRGLDNSGNVPSLDSHNKMEEFTKEGFSGSFNMGMASCFVSDSSLRISEEEKATTSNEETSANEETLMMKRREDEFSDSIGGDELREMQENINITSFKHNHLSSSQEEEEEQRSAKDYEENEVSSSRANGRILLRKDSDESVGDLEHQKEMEELSCVAERAVKGYFCPENYVTLKLQEKGLFAEDAFFKSARLHLLVGGGESSPNSGGLSSVSDELTSTKKLYCIDHFDQNKAPTFIEDEEYYTIILDVSCYSEKERVKVSVIEEKELSVEYSCVASDSELELIKTFSTRFVLPSGIDSGSGLCGISSDGILAVKFSKQKHSSCHKLERREDAGETQNCLNVEENLAYTTHFLQNRACISSEAKSDIVGVSDSKDFTSKTFSRFKIHSDSSDIQEHNNIKVTMLPFIKKGHFFHDSFFTEAQRLLQEAIKKVLMQSSEEETCRHSSDIKTYKCLRKQNPTWQNQAFHLEEDQYGCKVLLDAESLSEGSTVVYVLEGTELVIECQLETKVGSSHSLQTCKRSFSLPPNVDVNEATSALSSDGVLYIVFSKRDIP
ncbi:uncharacterized protein LOC135212156 [Macrobrachium nipponense]|uniref:uncharacterized protein LOC135212156 n=1 Tax=Macrobrachium nipponense TaxID=159736 RepID=UPI0030C85D4A